jgi:hypothetical protein
MVVKPRNKPFEAEVGVRIGKKTWNERNPHTHTDCELDPFLVPATVIGQ